ncbi:hypothetical protein F4808DRAFT_456911 [Astrocystis sublimbata]|nr:hypothetical protein F4808DRAFT_456911 [Astrocystis sublimbata]
MKTEPGCDRQSTSAPVHRQRLAWADNTEVDARRRLLIQEQALEVGLTCCEKLILSIEERFSKIAQHGKQSAEIVWSSESRREWILQCRDIIEDHADFKILVGVAGATGSGKTSALNALLGFRDLLPTNNEEAATAVLCKVAFNDDPRPEYAFRCHVTFQSKEALENKLRQFFRDLQIRDDLEQSHSGSNEDQEALREIESVLLPTREMISIVFGLQEEQIRALGLEGVLKSNTEAMALLGTVNKINSGGVEEISSMMKPYMDSTIAAHGNDSDATFAAWPLIEQVELFVKSDILHNGIVLVDLPGLGDAVESRALVAERAFNQLTSTLIVTQAARAADNSTAVSLMSKHHEMAMMMDGKFQKETFCVCVSQIDQIDRGAALRKQDAKTNIDLQRCLEEETELKRSLKFNYQEKKRAKTTLSKLRRAIKKQQGLSNRTGNNPDKLAATHTLLERLKGERNAQRQLITEVSRNIKRRKRRLPELDSAITFTCIQARNDFLRERIDSDFRKRQARFATMAPGMNDAHDGRGAVCPTSAKAFWKCEDKGRLSGFPSGRYTGIPGLASWIRDSTIPKRQAHVEDLLNRLQAQYNTIQLWSQDKCKLSDTPITKEDFEKEVLADSLTSYWSLLTAEINKMNPLPDKQAALGQCPDMCREAVMGWSYKKPDDKASIDKVHWSTYKANLSRSGGKFVSKAGADPHEYNWLGDISNVLFTVFVKDWNQALNHDIPNLTNVAWPKIDEVWDEFNANLKSNVEKFETRLLPELENEKLNLDTIKVNIKNRVRRALRRVSDHARASHPTIMGRVQSEWCEPFRRALEIKGNGSHKSRQELLVEFAREQSGKAFETAYKELQDKLQEGFDRLGQDLDAISNIAIKQLRAHISMLLDKLLEPKNLALQMKAVTEERERIQRYIQATLSVWDAHWDYSHIASKTPVGVPDQSIPREYRHSRTEFETLEDDVSKAGPESDTDSCLEDSSDDEDDAEAKDISVDYEDEKMEVDN